MRTQLEQLSIPFGAPALCHSDMVRLGAQERAVRLAMAHGGWMTLSELSEASGAPEASASARLRDLRRKGWTVDRRRRFGADRGTYEYRLAPRQV